MSGDFCTCFEDGCFDAGFSKLASGVLTQEDALPGPIQRVRIAELLLEELIEDGTLERIWDHAGHLAMMTDYTEGPTDPHTDWM